ncbi:MAG: hypothetical protein PHO98_11195, partial [Synergistaceae bacterium]|nr:hypothetical protein [Synergistaceae bacterium]
MMSGEIRCPAGGHKFFVIGEVRGGLIHSVTYELTGKARELADTVEGSVTAILLCGRLTDPVEAVIG